MSINDKLKIFDDPLFKFEEKSHKYTYNGVRLRSVTTFISGYHLPFDSENISKKVAQSTGQDQNDILEQWRVKNEKAKFIGSSTHLWIENYFNKIYQELPSNIETVKRINSFNIAWANYLHKLEPVAIEKRIFHKDWLIAGTIDSIFRFKDKNIIIDFKTNEEFRDDNHIKGTYDKLLPPFDDLWSNHMNEYSIQVSLYSLILEQVADIKIDKCFLLHIPSQGPKMYEAIDLRDRLSSIFKNQQI